MKLHLLHDRAASAAENMATDFMLLQRYPEVAARLRHYDWHRPAFTFGYSQKIAFVRAQLPDATPLELCRRPTGGGVVDHRDDWTYALVIPRGHDLEAAPATQSYRLIHEALATALGWQAIAAEVQRECAPPADGQTCGVSGVCFQRAELYDVVHARSGAKIAGAAQKRNKHGLLFQGSIARAAVGAPVDWEKFHADFAATLARLLALGAEPTPWPDWDDDELHALAEHYASPEWLEQR
ncbi:MAG: lipoate--protein ligase family protein [Opitutaceae bacterium]|nr:lipoate--protein ligase family protein [Opitutaceae bacterium]